jgi:hypothetical protein
MKRESNLVITLIGKTPNSINYKGQRGWTVDVLSPNGGSVLSRWKWVIRKCDETFTKSFAISKGWQQISDNQFGRWQLTENNGMKILRIKKI